MRIAVCPGSYDPITLGHIDIITRAAGIFDSVIVLVLQNAQKSARLPLKSRAAAAAAALKDLGNVSVRQYDGLAADFALAAGACAIVKGVRSVSDFEYELAIASVNASLGAPETLLLPAAPAMAHISSGTAVHLFEMGADVGAYLPPESVLALKESRGL